MKNKRLQISILLFFGLISLQAQNGSTASGGNASGIGGTVSYSVGQIANSTYSSTSGTVTQGLQQSYEIWIVTGHDEDKRINLVVSTYPNPTIDYLILNISDIDASKLSYHIFDIMGIPLETKGIIANQTRIDLCNFEPSTYFIKIISDNKEIKLFKIVKN